MIGVGLFDGGVLRRLTRATMHDQIADLTAELTRERNAATWGAVIADTAHTFAADRHGRVWGTPPGPDGEDTVTIPALRDVAAELGDGEPLRDTDPDWCSAHQSARQDTQAFKRPVPLWEAPFATPGPDAIDTAELHVVAVPYHDPANPAA